MASSAGRMMSVDHSAGGVPGTGVGEALEVQQAFWNRWNSLFVQNQRGPTSQRQAEVVLGWLDRWRRRDLDILEVGCGSGWMCSRLAAYGRVTGTDLSDEVLSVAQQKWPEVSFVAGDFMTMPLPEAAYDAVVTLEVLSHVPDQADFFRRIARSLRPGGQLMIATQNRFVLERWAEVAPRSEGQIRRWVSPRELRSLLEPEFVVDELFTVYPFAHGGILRIVNSPKLNRLAAIFFGQPRLDHWKERAGLGHTIMALATRRGAAPR